MHIQSGWKFALLQTVRHELRGLIATHGLPYVLVSENASAFMEDEFQYFIANNGIRHVTGTPYLQQMDLQKSL